MMDRLHQMNVFVAVAEEEGFAAGARRLHMSPPAVTRTVAALEDRLGVKLFNRTTRHVRATDAGVAYLADAQIILAAADNADLAAAGVNADPRGHLSVTAPSLFGRLFVIPGIIDYLERHPGTQVSAIFLDRVVNLLEEGLDVGVRIGELPDSSMRAIAVGSVRLVVCAAAAYLKEHEPPQHPEDLREHPMIASSAGSNFHDWRFASARVRPLRIEPRLTVTTNDAAIEAVVRGFGITRLLSYQVAPFVASGELKILLRDYEPPPRPIHILHREGRFASARIRTFVDLLARRLRGDKALND